jgi:hypothetical protein
METMARDSGRRVRRAAAGARARLRGQTFGLSLLLGLGLPSVAAAITAGELDDFQDGTTQGWVGGLNGAIPLVPPTVVADAGPMGPGDFALRVTGTGAVVGAGRAIVVNNVDPEWTGDYLTADVQEIMVDVRNLNDVPLTIRIGLDQPPLETGGGRWVSEGVVVPAASPWTTITFSVRPEDLLAGGPSAVDPVVTLADVGVLRILHATEASYMGDPIAGQLDIDNIEALPEPGLGSSLIGGIGLLYALGSWRRGC